MKVEVQKQVNKQSRRASVTRKAWHVRLACERTSMKLTGVSLECLSMKMFVEAAVVSFKNGPSFSSQTVRDEHASKRSLIQSL